MTAQDLDAGRDFGRYLDVDGDGIAYRTYPGTHPSKGSYFTRGTTKDRYARYTEEGPAYVDNMQRLLRKFETAKTLVPKPVLTRRGATDERGRHLVRVDRRRDGRIARRARTPGHPSRPASHPGVSVHDGSSISCRARTRVRRRAEPRRAAQDAARQRMGIDPNKLTPVLHYEARRSPRASSSGDRREGPRLNVTPGKIAQRRARLTHDLSRQTETAPPEPARNTLGYTRRDYEGEISTLCAGCGHDSISAAIIQAF